MNIKLKYFATFSFGLKNATNENGNVLVVHTSLTFSLFSSPINTWENDFIFAFILLVFLIVNYNSPQKGIFFIAHNL